MRRIGLAATLFISLVLGPLAGEAQRAATIPIVGFLGWGRAPTPQEMELAQALREMGWIEGQNVVIERRYGESDDQLHTLAAELVRLGVNVLVVPSCGMAKIAQTESNTIPIVIRGCGGAIVPLGLAASLARPGGNITGVQLMQDELIGKRLQLLKELLPKITRFAALGGRPTVVEINPTSGKTYAEAADAAARTLRLQRDSFAVNSPEDFPSVFRGMVAKGDRGLLVWGTPFMWNHRKQIIDLAATHRIAVIYEGNGWVEAGGLMSYGPNARALSRRAASYVDKILKGAKPGDLPIDQPTEFNLVINLKTAKALGLTIPQSVLGQADQIIE